MIYVQVILTHVIPVENCQWLFVFFQDLVGKLKDAAKSVEKASQM